MACLIKMPSPAGRGLVSFTTQERDKLIGANPAFRRRIEELKSRWVVGLHHNWHDHRFRYDPLFDFSMAGDGDLVEVNGTPFTRIGMDACNFSPISFRPAQVAPFWDVLYVARAVFFKRIPEFFQAVRTLYDQGHPLRILHICPIPDYHWANRRTELYNVREIYDSMFSQEEQNLFTLLTTTYRNPFPFDLDTLAHFYRSSRVFVHMANDERRCRVAGYAWATGIPVVGHSCVGSLLPAELRREPVFYEAREDSDFPSLILKALNHSPAPEITASARERMSATYTTRTFANQLAQSYLGGRVPTDDELESDWSLHGLDIRLGRHHGFGETPNSVPGFMKFLSFLDSSDHQPLASLVKRQADPERVIAKASFEWSGQDLDHVGSRNSLLRTLRAEAKALIKGLISFCDKRRIS